MARVVELLRGMDTCPQCGSNRINRSRSKGFFERLRREFSQKRLFRCQACGWRGWGVEADRPFTAEKAHMAEAPPPNLDAIDLALQESTGKPDAGAKA